MTWSNCWTLAWDMQPDSFTSFWDKLTIQGSSLLLKLGKRSCDRVIVLIDRFFLWWLWFWLQIAEQSWPRWLLSHLAKLFAWLHNKKTTKPTCFEVNASCYISILEPIATPSSPFWLISSNFGVVGPVSSHPTPSHFHPYLLWPYANPPFQKPMQLQDHVGKG